MPRPPPVIPNRPIHTTLPEELATRLDLILWSDLEGKVPYGAFQAFLIQALNDYLNNQAFDLSPFAGSTPGSHIVRCRPSTITLLTTLLKEPLDEPTHTTPLGK